MSMQLPSTSAMTRITISSVKPNQRLRWLASKRPVSASAAAIVQPDIDCATASASPNAWRAGSTVRTGAMSG